MIMNPAGAQDLSCILESRSANNSARRTQASFPKTEIGFGAHTAAKRGVSVEPKKKV